jgi:hypothetical protein
MYKLIIYTIIKSMTQEFGSLTHITEHCTDRCQPNKIHPEIISKILTHPLFGLMMAVTQYTSDVTQPPTQELSYLYWYEDSLASEICDSLNPNPRDPNRVYLSDVLDSLWYAHNSNAFYPEMVQPLPPPNPAWKSPGEKMFQDHWNNSHPNLPLLLVTPHRCSGWTIFSNYNLSWLNPAASLHSQQLLKPLRLLKRTH